MGLKTMLNLYIMWVIMKKLVNRYMRHKHSVAISCALLGVLAMALTGCVMMDKIYAKFPPADAPQHTVSVLDSYADGEILHCKIGAGSANINHQWLDIKEKAFLVIKNGRSNVNLLARYHKGKSTSMQTIFDHKGQKITLCPLTSVNSSNKVECLNLYFLDKDLDIGIKRSVNISRFLRGSAITCAYNKQNFKPVSSPE